MSFVVPFALAIVLFIITCAVFVRTLKSSYFLYRGQVGERAEGLLEGLPAMPVIGTLMSAWAFEFGDSINESMTLSVGRGVLLVALACLFFADIAHLLYAWRVNKKA